MNVLITGGNGYVAKSLHHALNSEYNITSITRSNFDLLDSVAVANYFSDKFYDVVIHTAAVGGSRLKPDTAEILDTNLRMYYNLLDNSNMFGKFLYFGSGAEYTANTYYSTSKCVIATSMLAKKNFYNLKIFGVFDENEWDTRFIKTNLTNYIYKKPISIYENKKMTFFYMKDLVSVVKYYIDSPNSKLLPTYHCTYKNDLSLVDIANYINQLADYCVDVNVGSESDTNYISIFKEDLNLQFIGLENGIKETYDKLLHKHSS